MRIRVSYVCGAAEIATVLTVSALCSACSVPVFRYALEQWPPDNYQLYLFHHGDLNEGERELLTAFDTPGSDGAPAVNLQLATVDLNQDPDPELLAIWEAQSVSASSRKPILVLQTPSRHGHASIWTGELSPENVAKLIDSAARQEIARRILGGDSVVWVFLESGESETDDRAYETLVNELADLQQKIELPELAAEDATALAIESDSLKLSFSALRLSRDDPNESLLIDLLLNVESDLREPEFAGKPMVFPIFGRGRALYALVGEGITANLIDEAARFLTGACQCTVKAQNPGVDLLMNVDWDQLVTPTLEQNRELPPLAGLTGFSDPDAERTSITATVDEKSDDPAEPAKVIALAPSAAATGKHNAASSAGVAIAPSSNGTSLGVLVLGALLAVGLIVGLASIALLRREV